MRIVREKKLRLVFLLFVWCSGVLSSLNSDAGAEQLSVYVVNYPLKYFAERIGGDYVEVLFPAPPDVDPAYWTPDVATIAKYQQADLIMLNGAGYAKWVKKASLPRSRIVDVSKGFKSRYISSEDVVTHSHGPEGKHAHENLAFTTWLDFQLAVLQAEAVAEALGRKLPQHRKIIERNVAALKNDLLSLDEDMRGIVARNPKQLFIASHPVYDYLTRAYGLNMKSLHWEPDEFPDDEKWMALQQILKDHPATWMIWEGEPLAETVEQLKTIGIDSLVFDPCANQPPEGNFYSIMQQNIKNLGQVYTQ